MAIQPLPQRRAGMVRRTAIVVFAVVTALTLLAVHTPRASAHAELLQSSPAAGSIVGGEFHSIVLHFSDIDWNGTHVAELYGPDGAQVPTQAIVHERQRLTIPIEPLTVPGLYTVTYTTEGVDNDVITDSLSFRFDPAADRPTGITLSNGGDAGFDWVGFGLLLVGAGLLAFLVARFVAAVREHRAAQRISSD